MAAPKKGTPKEREKHLTEVWALYITGMYQTDIAKQLGVSRQQIAYDLILLERRWRESNLESVNDYKLKELAKIDQLEKEYRDAWEKSSGIHKKETTIETTGENSSLTEKVESQELVGDPAFLRGIEWCVDARTKILGIAAPVKSEINVTTDLTKLSEAELKAKARGLLDQSGVSGSGSGTGTPGTINEVA